MLILDNEITRARFAVHLELTENRLILDNEITRASIRCPLWAMKICSVGTISNFEAGLLENGLMDFQLEGGFWYLRVKGYKIVLRARSPRKLHSRDIFNNFFPGLPRAECSMNEFVALET